MSSYQKLFLFFIPLLSVFFTGCENSSTQSYEGVDIEHYTVFAQGEEGYHTHRIPSIIQAKNGNLIAIVEGRRDNGRDPGGGHIDLVYKLSDDGGRNWSSLRLFEKSQEGWSASNPTSVVDRTNGRIFVLYDVWQPERGGRNSRPGTLDNQLRIRHSDDNGNSWSDAEDITEQGRDIERWGRAVFGPGHGIQTATGRLVIPVNAPAIFGEDTLTASFALYSDDGGISWERGEQLSAPTNENMIVELEDGRLMIDARQSDRTSPTRWVAISHDQGQTWDEPEQGHLCPPICAGIISYSQKEGNNLLLWSGIKGPQRTNLIIRLSSDQGLSFPVELLVGPGPAAYSVMTMIGEDDLGVLWEGGKEWRYEKVIFSRIPKEIITNLNLLTKCNRSIH